MKRSQIINLCLYATILAIGVAVVLKMLYAPPSAGGGGMGGDAFILISPVFFVMAAKKATRFGSAAVVIALIGLAFAMLGLYGAVETARKPVPKAAPASPGRR